MYLKYLEINFILFWLLLYIGYVFNIFVFLVEENIFIVEI